MHLASVAYSLPASRPLFMFCFRFSIMLMPFATENKTPAAMTTLPANINPPANWFRGTLMMVPAIGFPMRIPIAAKQNDIPIHVPTNRILGAKAATTAEGNDTTAPDRKP